MHVSSHVLILGLLLMFFPCLLRPLINNTQRCINTVRREEKPEWRRRTEARQQRTCTRAKRNATLFTSSLLAPAFCHLWWHRPRWRNTSCDPPSSLESSAALSPNSFPLMDIASAPSLLLSVTFIIWIFFECPSTFYWFNPVREQKGNKGKGDDTTMDGWMDEKIMQRGFFCLLGSIKHQHFNDIIWNISPWSCLLCVFLPTPQKQLSWLHRAALNLTPRFSFWHLGEPTVRNEPGILVFHILWEMHIRELDVFGPKLTCCRFLLLVIFRLPLNVDPRLWVLVNSF